MAGFFQKVMWTECLGEVDQKCSKLVNKEHLPAYKAKCSECGGKVRELAKLDPVKAGTAALLALLLAGGGYWYEREKLPGFGGGSAGAPAPANSSPLKWAVDTDRDGSTRHLTLQDFDATGSTYRAREAFHAGDRLRIEVGYTNDRLYAYTTTVEHGSPVAERVETDSRGRTTLPPEAGKWYQLDNEAGTEEFVLVSSNGSLPDFDQLSGRFDPAALDGAVRKAEGRKDVSVARIRIPHR